MCWCQTHSPHAHIIPYLMIKSCSIFSIFSWLPWKSPIHFHDSPTFSHFFPKQLWSWMGFSILARNRLCSIIISGFRVGFRGLSPYSFGILFQHLFWFRVGFRRLSPYSFGILFQHLFWFRVWFRGLSPYSFGIRFHHLFWFRVGFRGLSP